MNLVNAVVSTGLVTGLGFFPHVGWTGLAIGATSGHCVGGLIVLFRLARRNGVVDIRSASTPWSVDVPKMRRILRIGIPGGIDIWAVLACHLTYAAIINSLGTLAQAAHGLGLQIEAMSYLPGSAFSVAAATIAGQSLGASDQRRAVRGVLLCASCAAAIMATAGLLMFFCGESIAMFFTGQPDELAIFVGRLLKIVAISCPASDY